MASSERVTFCMLQTIILDRVGHNKGQMKTILQFIKGILS